MLSTLSKIALASLAVIIIMAFTADRIKQIDPDATVISVLEELGEDYSQKKANTAIKGVSAEVGRTIVLEGFAPKPDGGKTGRQSKHFVCTSCHNVEREDPDLTISDPEARLLYTSDRDLPYLQGTTLYGAVNRETYYNGDYYKKYGDLVDAARNDIRGAIQLCAVECAQGRALEGWELESVLAYLWTIGLKMSDLNLSEAEINTLERAVKDGTDSSKAIDIIESKYLKGSPATFIAPPENRKVGTGLIGNPERGAMFYKSSCLHCHKNGEYSFMHLDDHKITHRYLNRKADGYSRHSIYQVTRWGVPSKSGKRSYMPQYTVEKMSDQQLADLRAYIRYRAN